MLIYAMMQRLIIKHWKIYIGATRFIHLVEMKLKRELRDHKYRILISATFPKDMPQEKVRKIMCDRVAKWKAEKRMFVGSQVSWNA